MSYNANKTGDGKPPTTPPGPLPSFPYYAPQYGTNNYPPYQIRPGQSFKPMDLPTGYVSANQPPGPLKGPTASQAGQRGTAPPSGFAPQRPMAPLAPMGPGLTLKGDLNHASQMPYGSHTSPSHNLETMPGSNVSPKTPRVVLPPLRGHKHDPNTQTPTRSRTKGQGTGTKSPSGNISSGRPMTTDPRQTVPSNPTFNNHYLPMEARDIQNSYKGQQQQMPHSHISSPAHPTALQVLDKHARQRILDEQAKSFSEEDDAAFYPHKD
ncbi:hypothetical protein F4814DRAFT_445160 [Daldinia grandis]|nr:hypothetical protein F4814DRAFT_445160 [Daldinia grandis]